VGNWHRLLPVNLKSARVINIRHLWLSNGCEGVSRAGEKYGDRVLFPGYNRMSESLGRAIEAVLLGKSSPAEALKAASSG